MTYMKPKCWVCLGKGHVRGSDYSLPCSNPHCVHAARLRMVERNRPEAVEARRQIDAVLGKAEAV